MATTSNNTAASISITTILTLILVTLKMTGLINWSWIWVLSPLWIGAALSIVLVVFVVVVLSLLDR